MRKDRIVAVEWDDATFDSGYYDATSPNRYKQLKTKTVGLVVKSDRKQIIVATDSWLNNEGKAEYRHISTIPKKMIKRIRKLEG